MFGSKSGIASYNKVKLDNSVDTANPHALVMMLFDGAVLSLATAAQAMREKRIADKGNAISQAISIISSGLQASLNLEAGGELGSRLDALYDYMCSRLLYANLKNDLAAIEEVSSLLGELRGAWGEIAKDTSAISGNKETA